MENPATWGKVRRLINEVIYKDAQDKAAGYIGSSLGSKIYNALYEKGYVVEDVKEDA